MKTKLIFRSVTMLALQAIHALAHAQSGPLQLYVSPNGNDRWAGTLSTPSTNKTNGPKRTLQGAQLVIRQKNRFSQLPVEGAVVNVLPGEYPMTSQLFFDSVFDSGTPTGPIVWKGAGGNRTILDSSRILTVWRKLTGRTSRVSESVRKNLIVCDLRQMRVPTVNAYVRRGFPNWTDQTYPELMYNGQRMQIAGYPNAGSWLTIPDNHNGANDRFVSTVPADRGWGAQSDLWTYGFLAWNWADSFDKVKTYTPSTGVVELNAPMYYGIKAKQRFRFINVLEELDQPGEYFIDRAAQKVYFYPPSREIGRKISMTLGDSALIRTMDQNYITFEGLTIQGGRGNGVQVYRGSNVNFKGCTVRNIGTDGIQFYDSASSGLDSCDIYNIGEQGVLIRAGNRFTLTSGNNFVRNCDIHDYAQLCKTFRPAVRIEGCGNVVANNRIVDGPHMGIWIVGNNQIVERNYIKNVCADSDDAGAIYTVRNPTQLGNEIRYNIIEDLPRAHATPRDDKVNGVYLDDFSSGWSVYGNIFRRVDQGIQVGGGRDNNIFNNVFQDCRLGIQVDARMMTWNSVHFTNGTIRGFFDEVDFQNEPYLSAYPGIENYFNDNPQQPKRNKIKRNVVVGGTMYALYDGLTVSNVDDDQTWLTDQNNYFGTDPGFTNLGANNLGLISGGNAELIGFQPIDVSQIGLQVNQYRTSVPSLTSGL
ncbi:MAG: right-handed parallel beta-helix repeat-containing protein [Armatimonadetes bacterium]|nr:right-handed parallel beta-helix repeat-containing protein [Armatimonadota bacterium]